MKVLFIAAILTASLNCFGKEFFSQEFTIHATKSEAYKKGQVVDEMFDAMISFSDDDSFCEIKVDETFFQCQRGGMNPHRGAKVLIPHNELERLLANLIPSAVGAKLDYAPWKGHMFYVDFLEQDLKHLQMGGDKIQFHTENVKESFHLLLK